MSGSITFTDEHPHIGLLLRFPERLRELLGSDDLNPPLTDRNMLVCAQLSQALGHYRGVSTLTASGLHGSTAALLRVLFESYTRAAWMHHCAEPKELSQLWSKDKLTRRGGGKGNKRFSDFIDEISEKEPTLGETLAHLHENTWDALNSFTHSGAKPVARQSGWDKRDNLDGTVGVTARRA